MKNHLMAALSARAHRRLLSRIPLRAADLKIGLLLPKSGPYAALGKEIEDGFTMAH